MRTLVISDMHHPYAHPRAFEFVREVADDFKPDKVVCVGDEVDAHAWSRYGSDPDAPSASAETRLARERLEPFFKRFPTVYVCDSNHGGRAIKAGKRAGLPSEWVRDMHQALGVPKGWKWRQMWEFDGVYYHHGENYSGVNSTRQCALDLRRSCVIGHVHTAGGVTWLTGRVDSIFGMSVGCLIDDTQPAFDYCRTNPKRPVLGLGIVEDGKPQFIPMI